MIDVESGCKDCGSNEVFLGVSVIEHEGKFIGCGAILEGGVIVNELVSDVAYNTAKEAAEDIRQRLEVFVDDVMNLVAYVDSNGELVEDKCFNFVD